MACGYFVLNWNNISLRRRAVFGWWQWAREIEKSTPHFSVSFTTLGEGKFHQKWIFYQSKLFSGIYSEWKLNLRRRRQGLKVVELMEKSFQGMAEGGGADEKLLRQDYLINFPDGSWELHRTWLFNCWKFVFFCHPLFETWHWNLKLMLEQTESQHLSRRSQPLKGYW